MLNLIEEALELIELYCELGPTVRENCSRYDRKQHGFVAHGLVKLQPEATVLILVALAAEVGAPNPIEGDLEEFEEPDGHSAN